MRNWVPVSVLLCMVACEREPRYFYVPDNVQRAFLFTPSSWWVYLDSVHHTTDSVVVDSLYRYFRFDQGYDEKHEVIGMRLKSFRLSGDSSVHFPGGRDIILNHTGGVGGYSYSGAAYFADVSKANINVFGIEYKDAEIIKYKERPNEVFIVKKNVGLIRGFFPPRGSYQGDSFDYYLVKSQVQMHQW